MQSRTGFEMSAKCGVVDEGSCWNQVFYLDDPVRSPHACESDPFRARDGPSLEYRKLCRDVATAVGVLLLTGIRTLAVVFSVYQWWARAEGGTAWHGGGGGDD